MMMTAAYDNEDGKEDDDRCVRRDRDRDDRDDRDRRRHRRRHKVRELMVKKGVSFSNDVVPDAIHPTIHINDYTSEEIYATWYTSNEYKNMRKERNYVRTLLEKNLLVVRGYDDDDDEDDLLSLFFCPLGIETEEEMIQNETDRRIIIDAVLDEQYIQWKEGVNDINFLSCIYKLACRRRRRNRASEGTYIRVSDGPYANAVWWIHESALFMKVVYPPYSIHVCAIRDADYFSPSDIFKINLLK